MRNKYQQVHCIFHFIGSLLLLLGLLLLFPIVISLYYQGEYGEGFSTMSAFLVPALLAFICGYILRVSFKQETLTTTASMLLCALSWIIASAFGAIPFVIGIKAGWLNAYFEAMSGFTTTGITVFTGLDSMPRSILFWRSVTQWLGGIGILSFFLMITYASGGAHHIFGAESHKISSGRPAPGLFSTLKILWGIYVGYTIFSVVILTIEKMPVFDAICHSLTALSTGGFSPHDASIEYYRISGHPNYKLIEYTLTFLMMLGGINFLIHYRVLNRDIKALWDNLEIRYWWRLITLFLVAIMTEHLLKTGFFTALFNGSLSGGLAKLESTFRYTIFQVTSILTTTGFGTKDINTDFFPAVSKQLFLVMMVIGGCVGSTGGGLKVLRVAILNRMMIREIFKLRVSSKASSKLVVDKKPVSDDEAHRIAGFFFVWILLLVIGGAITALFSEHGPWESVSGMFSAVGNIGPCYLSVQQIIELHPVVKITYIFGMLAGRLEILPVLLLFSRKAWR